MILNPIALATKGYIGNTDPLTIASKGYVDLSGAPVTFTFGMYAGIYQGLYANFYKFSQ